MSGGKILIAPKAHDQPFLTCDAHRREFLTGFRKRKQARIEERRQNAKKRDHEEHLAERREARRELKKRAEENVRQVRLAMGLSADPQDEQDGGSERASYQKARAGARGRGRSALNQDGGAQEDDSDGDDDDGDDDESDQDQQSYSGDEQHAVVTIQDDFEDQLVDGASNNSNRPAVDFLPPSSRNKPRSD